MVLAAILTVIFLPVFLVAPFIIKLSSKGGVLYRQKRVGKDNREFILYKFRSMVDNADEIIANDQELFNKFKASDWKLDRKDDPRITKFGGLMRALTIDEFPQIWNVIRGEMSIVGPRAYRRQEIEDQLKRHPKAASLMGEVLSVKPGITGPWQTSGRNNIPFLSRAKMDAEYARNWSIGKDLIIVLKTPKAMISKW